MKYSKCLICNQLGNTCDGPNFLAMDAAELGLWCNEKRKHIPGMTYDRIAAETGISKSAVHSFLTGAHSDYRIETIRPIIKLITGGKWDDNPCGNITNSEKAAYEEKIRQLEKEINHQKDTIHDLHETKDSLQLLVANTNERYTKDKDFLRSQIKNRNKTVTILATFLGLFILLFIGLLIIDRMNGEIGFFWLEGLFGPHGSGAGLTLTGSL